MIVAFVGVKRKYQELPENYRDKFTQYHLELPYYFARFGGNKVTVTTVDYGDVGGVVFTDSMHGLLQHVTEDDFKSNALLTAAPYDVVVHWRKWFPELYRPEAINVINCQDHSFSEEWKREVREAYGEGKLYGILCFPKWHKGNLLRELGGFMNPDRAIDGLTLGVDTDIYHPIEAKDPYQLLWASDPGRGLYGALQLAHKLFTIDKRFRLNVCYPDYVTAQRVSHPAVIWHGNVSNGERLFRLFNECGVLPYTSNFMEPSSRAHRQAMAAGSMVLYPPNMGTPSDLIQSGKTGIVELPQFWASTISKAVESGNWKKLGAAAREYAISENWAVQARRFNEYFQKVLNER